MITWEKTSSNRTCISTLEKTTYLFIVAVTFNFIFSIFLPPPVYAQESDKSEKVVITGIGVDIDKAKQNAIRNAVERVIGSYVVSDTIVKNSQLLKDEILSYSGGYLKEMKIISQGQNEDGLFSVQIEAVVISTKLKRKLESLNIATKKVEGESLFGEAISRINEQKDASSLLKETLSKFPQAAYVITFGKPEIKTISSTKNTAEVIIPLTIKWDAKFIAELKDVISRVSKENLKMVSIISVINKYDIFKHVITFNDELQKRAVCFSTKAILKRKKAESCGIIDSSLYKEVIDKGKVNLISSENRLDFGVDTLALFVYFKDIENNIVYTYEYNFSPWDGDSSSQQKIWKDEDSDTSYLNAVFGQWSEGSNFPNKLGDDLILLLTDGEYNMNLEVEIDAGKLESISTIEARLEMNK